MLAPLVEKIARTFTARVSFVKVNTDENCVLARQFGISRVPWKRAQAVERIVGVPPKAEKTIWPAVAGPLTAA